MPVRATRETPGLRVIGLDQASQLPGISATTLRGRSDLGLVAPQDAASDADRAAHLTAPSDDDLQQVGVVALVANARQARGEARAQFAALARDRRAIILRTRHRVELYAATDERDAAGKTISLPELPAGGRQLQGADAVRHLLKVAAGLDSVVIGEDQILHQLRDCRRQRRLAGLGVAATYGMQENGPLATLREHRSGDRERAARDLFAL